MLTVVCVVIAVVGPLGFAMTGHIGLLWAVPGAVIWTILFGFAGARTGRSPVAWGLAGGLICGTVWALGEVIAAQLLQRRFGLWVTLWIAAVSGGLGGGALIGAAFGRAHSSTGERALKIAAFAMGSGLGFSVGLFFASAEWQSPLWLRLGFVLTGTTAGLMTGVAGRRLGLTFRPSVIFFDQLWPYLREMAIPLAAFAVGFACLTLAFAGFYGTLWRLDSASFAGFRGMPGFWDFVYFSLMTASTANTDVTAVSRSAQVLTALEVVLGLGWLIVVFGALSAHLAPRLEAIASGLHSHQLAGLRQLPVAEGRVQGAPGEVAAPPDGDGAPAQELEALGGVLKRGSVDP
jgi:hypothetical protein